MKNIIIKSSIANNYTPTVMAALASIKASGGGCIEFEKGEFHFYKEGTLKTFFAVSNNTPCDKHVVFPIFNMKNVKIKGNGAAFVFHETVFPREPVPYRIRLYYFQTRKRRAFRQKQKIRFARN